MHRESSTGSVGQSDKYIYSEPILPRRLPSQLIMSVAQAPAIICFNKSDAASVNLSLQVFKEVEVDPRPRTLTGNADTVVARCPHRNARYSCLICV